MTTDERIRFIELRKCEIDLAREMVQHPDDLQIWTAWYSAAMQVDELCEAWDPAELEILDDLNKMLRMVYSGAFGVEDLARAKCDLDSALTNSGEGVEC